MVGGRKKGHGQDGDARGSDVRGPERRKANCAGEREVEQRSGEPSERLIKKLSTCAASSG